MHAHPIWHPHAHHAHIHTTHMYARVYTCTHYGHKGHLTKFCFNRLYSSNFANKNVWVPIATNPNGPKKKIWVPKFPLLIFYVGVGSHKT